MTTSIHSLAVASLISLLAAGAARAASPDESLKGLPAPVQKTIQAERGKMGLVKVEAKTKDGKTRYKIVLAVGAMQRRLFVDASGKLLRLKNDVALDALPAPVRKTVDTNGQSAKFVRSTKITGDGKVEYEAEFDLGGRSRTVLVDAGGQVERVEEVVTLAAVPAPAKAAVEKEVGSGKLLKVVGITKAGQPTIYEAQLEAGGKKSEIKLAADGKILERE